MKRAFPILLCSAIHFVAGVVLFWVSFSRGLGRMISGEGPSRIETLCDGALIVLWSPVLPLGRWMGIEKLDLGLFSWLLLGANSLIWGAVIYTLLIGLRRLVGRK